MRAIPLLVCTIGIVGSNSLVLSPISSEVATSFGSASAADVMTASALFGGGVALSALILAPQADRIGVARALYLALIALTACLAASAAAPSLPWLILAQTLAGAAAGVALPAVYSLAAQLAPPGRESQTLGTVLTGWTLSLVAGVTLSALLADLAGWRMVYAALTAASLLTALGLRRLARSGPPQTASTARSPIRALTIPGILPALISMAAFMTAFYGLYAYLGIHLQSELGLSTTVAGLAALLYGLGFGAISPLDRLIDRYGPRRAAPVAFVILAMVYAGLALTSGSAPLLLAACLVWGAANHISLNLLIGNLTALDPTRRGAVMGLNSFVTYAAMFAGTAAYKPIFEAAGFAVIAGLSALSILAALGLSIRHARRPSSA